MENLSSLWAAGKNHQNVATSLQHNTRAHVCIGGEESMVFEIESGVKQEGMESDILFNMVLDLIIRKLLEKIKANGVKIAYDRDLHTSTGGQHKLMIVLEI